MVRSSILIELEIRDLPKLDQHVNEMMTTAGKKFHNLLLSRFLIIMQNVNMDTNGKCNCRLIPISRPVSQFVIILSTILKCMVINLNNCPANKIV